MKPKQEEALRDYLRESIVPLLEDVLTKKLGQAITFAKEDLTPPAAQRQWVGLTDEDIEQEFGFIDELLRDCVQRTEAKLREKNT
jgi:hypothetical protein